MSFFLKRWFEDFEDFEDLELDPTLKKKILRTFYIFIPTEKKTILDVLQ